MLSVKCSPQECRLCLGCLTPELRLIIKRAYLEHINRRTWRRVLPISFQVRGFQLLQSISQYLHNTSFTNFEIVGGCFLGVLIYSCQFNPTWYRTVNRNRVMSVGFMFVPLDLKSYQFQPYSPVEFCTLKTMKCKPFILTFPGPR